MSKKLKIGLFGFGTVGQSFYELLLQSKNPSLEIKTIVIKNSTKARKLDAFNFSTSSLDILNDPEIDIVVELIDDATDAFEILKQSLQQRKPVVTANKKMLAENLEEIYCLQKKYDTPVLYEGAVCGSIPIIRNLELYFAFDEIKSIEGILNGSTNYILTKMIKEQISYSEALDEAKKLGFAESDPTLDVKGFDSKYKLAILIAHTFGCFINPDHILNLGIDRITEHDMRFAKQQGYTIKLIAKAERIGSKIFGIVAPQFVSLENPLAHVNNEFNGVTLIGASVGLQTLTGKGAGGLPTGLAVYSDVAGMLSNFHYHYSKVETSENLEFMNGLINVRASFEGMAPIHISDFEKFTGGFQGQGRQFMNGWVTSRKFQEWITREEFSIILNADHITEPGITKKEWELNLA